jgi:hypothetical protein
LENKRLDTLLQRFAIAAAAHHAALEAMDVERADRQAHMISTLYQAILAAGTAGTERFNSLLDHPDPAVAGMAAVYVITANSEQSLKTLRRVANEPGLLGFRAAAAIDRWYNGEWE